MKPIEIIATDLFEKVRSRFTNLQIGDDSGSVTANPADARFFDFDFSVEGNVLGRVSISINEIGNLKVFYSQGIMENADSITQTMWYDFLKEMRFFAKRRLLSFDTRDITKGNLDKTDFQYLAQNGPKDNDMNESAMYGSSRTSHRKLDNTDLIIRHKDKIDPTKPGARSRQIKNLFIQNEEGERFKFPFIYLPGARAMQRHVANGGLPYDPAGENIIKTCEEILKLSDFGRKVKHSTLNDNAHSIAEKAGTKLKALRHHMECMSKQGYYESWKESYAPNEGDLIELDDATMESYKDTFTQTKFDEALADVFPLLHSIMQEAGEVDLESYVGESQVDDEEEITIEEAGADDEFAAFESWTESIIGEGFSDEELAQLEPLMQEPMPIGANDEAVQTLAGIGIKDPTLVKALRAQAAMPNGADADARETIQTYLGADATKISFGDLNAQAAPAPTEVPVEQPVAETVSPALQRVFDDWMNSEHAPYNDMAGDDKAVTQKAREYLFGTVPDNQVDMIAQKLSMLFHGEEDMTESVPAKGTDIADKSYLKTAGKKPGVVGKAVDTAKQAGKWLAGKGGPGKEGDTYEGAIGQVVGGTVGRLAGGALGAPLGPAGVAVGSALGAAAGGAIGDKIGGEEEETAESAFMGPEDFPEWLKDATHRVAHGKVSDWTELAAELTSDLGFDDDKADRIAKRLYSHDTLAQYRVAPPEGDLEKGMPSDSGEDDDNAFLNKLRGQARSGSIKQGADTGEIDETGEPAVNALKEVAKLVSGFYNREDGTWTKGEQGVITHVKRQFTDESGNGGEHEADLAAKLIQHLNSKHESNQQFEAIRKLAGLPELTEAEKTRMSRAAKGNEKYGKDGMKA